MCSSSEQTNTYFLWLINLPGLDLGPSWLLHIHGIYYVLAIVSHFSNYTHSFTAVVPTPCPYLNVNGNVTYTGTVSCSTASYSCNTGYDL